MKKLLISILLFATVIGCDKEVGNLKHLETISGGCALDKGSSQKSAPWKNDSVSYKIIDGNLDLFVGFNATCCGKFNTSASIKGDSILIKIVESQIGLCDCICYYTYDFKFLGNGDYYNYRITIANYKVFTGHIKP
jgi:hypothetical protein